NAPNAFMRLSTASSPNISLRSFRPFSLRSRVSMGFAPACCDLGEGLSSRITAAEHAQDRGSRFSQDQGQAFMTSASFDFAPVLAAGLAAPAARWTGLAKYSFVGGNNDADQLPVDRLTAAVTAVLAREGRTLATYGLNSGPLGYLPLREFLAGKLKRTAGIACGSDEILIT